MSLSLLSLADLEISLWIVGVTILWAAAQKLGQCGETCDHSCIYSPKSSVSLLDLAYRETGFSIGSGVSTSSSNTVTLKAARSPCFLVAPATHRKRGLPGCYLRYCFAARIQVSRRPFNTRMDGDIDSSQQSLCANDPNLPDNNGKCEIQREPRTSSTSVRLRLRGGGRMLLNRRPGPRPSLISQCKVHVPHSRIWKSRMWRCNRAY